MDLTLNAVYLKVPEGYIAFVEELPGANTQGATLEEAREKLTEAVAPVFFRNDYRVQDRYIILGFNAAATHHVAFPVSC